MDPEEDDPPVIADAPEEVFKPVAYDIAHRWLRGQHFALLYRGKHPRHLAAGYGVTVCGKQGKYATYGSVLPKSISCAACRVIFEAYVEELRGS